MSNPLTKSQFDSIIKDNVLKHSGLKSSPFLKQKMEKRLTPKLPSTKFWELKERISND